MIVTAAPSYRTSAAAQPPASAPAPAPAPADQVDLSGLKGLPRVLMTVGSGMARLGWGGALVGAGLGLAIGGGPSGGWLLPALSAFLIGSDCASSRRGLQVMNSGFEAIEKAAARRQPFTPAPGAASALTITACCAELAAAYTLSGGGMGILLAAPFMLGTAYVMGKAAGQAQGYVLDQALKHNLQP